MKSILLEKMTEKNQRLFSSEGCDMQWCVYYYIIGIHLNNKTIALPK